MLIPHVGPWPTVRRSPTETRRPRSGPLMNSSDAARTVTIGGASLGSWIAGVSRIVGAGAGGGAATTGGGADGAGATGGGADGAGTTGGGADGGGVCATGSGGAAARTGGEPGVPPGTIGIGGN